MSDMKVKLEETENDMQDLSKQAQFENLKPNPETYASSGRYFELSFLCIVPSHVHCMILFLFPFSFDGVRCKWLFMSYSTKHGNFCAHMKNHICTTCFALFHCRSENAKLTLHLVHLYKNWWEGWVVIATFKDGVFSLQWFTSKMKFCLCFCRIDLFPLYFLCNFVGAQPSQMEDMDSRTVLVTNVI